MKILLTVIIILAYNLDYKTQIISDSLKQQIISDLDSTDYFIRWSALNQISDYNLSEAIPKIESIFWNQEPFLQVQCLKNLFQFNSQNFHNLALAFIDSADNYSYEDNKLKALDLKVVVTTFLFHLNDYSTTNYVLQILYRDRGQPYQNSYAVDLLPRIIKNVPQYADSARYELIRIVINDNTNEKQKYRALRFLNELYGEDFNQIYLQVFLSDADRALRYSALKYLFKEKYSELNTVLNTNLFLENEKTLRYEIAKVLLDSFGGPADYANVKKYLLLEPDLLIKNLVNQNLQIFRPVMIDSTLSMDGFIDKNTQLLDTIYNYIWLGDLTFSNELKNILTTAKTDLQNGDSLACRVQVKAFQDLVDNVYKDSLNSDPRFVTIEGWKFLYWNAQYILDRLPEPPANPNLLVNLKNSLGNQIPANNVQYYEGSWKDAVNNGDGTFTVITTIPTVSIRVYYEYASKQADNVNAQNNTYTFQTVNAAVQLKNSLGNLIDVGTVQYYAGAWRSFGTTSNGVVTKELLPITYSFRMTYEYGSLDKQQNLSVDPTVVFQTVNAAVQLKNSLGNLIDVGTVQYYAGAWRTFGTTTNGIANKELLPITYSFRMTYEYGSIDKQQNLSVDPTIVFQTVNAAVQLKNSLGNLIDVGTIQYYAGAWRTFGTTVNGVAAKELLPITYSFRMTYEYGSIDKQQNLSVDPIVVFQTVNATVKLLNSQNALIDVGTVQYYAGAWRTFGTTSNGVATKELLPITYSFRMTYEYVSKDKQQNLSTNPVVDFNTVLCSVKVSKTSNNQPINNAEVKYYSGAWRDLGTTNADGIASKELLPANLSFRASYGNVSLDKQQDITVNNLVEILLNVP